MRLPVLLLLLLLLVQLTSTSGFVITEGKIGSVPASAQVSSNQVYAKTWQIRANPSQNATVIEKLWLSGARVFVSYVEASASTGSDVIAEVKISGDSEAVVNANEVIIDPYASVSGNTKSPTVKVDWRSSPTDDAQYLLTEVVLHKKRQVKRIYASVIGDLVVEDNVVFSTTKDVVKAFPARAPSTSTGAVLKLEKKPFAAYGPDTWYASPVKNVSNTTGVKLGLKSTFAGNVTIRVTCSLSPLASPDGSIARIGTAAYDAGHSQPIYGGVVSVAPGTDFDTLVVHADSTLSGTKIASFQVELETLPSVQVELVDLASSVFVDDACSRYADEDAGLNFQLDGVRRNAFIVDKDASLFATEATFGAPIGNLQIEVKELTTSALALRSLNGNINYFSTGATTSNSITATPNFGAKVCLASSNDLKVVYLDPRKASQVSFTGRAGGNTLTCTKVAVPKREPAQLKESNGDLNSTSKNSTMSSSASRIVSLQSWAMHSTVLAVGLIVASAL